MPLEGFKDTKLNQIFNTHDRRSAFRVLIWNPREAKTVQDVVLDQWGGMEYDISQFVKQITITQNQAFENNDDALSSRATLIITIDDKGLEFPWGNLPITHRMFRDGTPVKIFVGDERIYREDWMPVFTGTIRGFPSADLASRKTEKQIRVQAFGREQAYQNQIITGVNWSYGTDLGAMAQDVAQIEMGLQAEEIRFGTFQLQTRHKSNAITQVTKMQGLNEIMKHVGRRPYFDANGRLVSHDLSFDKPPVGIYKHDPVIIDIARRAESKSTINSVEVIGLRNVLTQVIQPSSELLDINTTVGFFDTHYREIFFYSKDRTRRVRPGTSFPIIEHSRTLGSDFGGSAEWLEIDEFRGKLSIDTGYAPWVIGSIIAIWSILAVIEAYLDSGEEAPIGLATGAVLLLVRLAKAAAMVTLLIAMQNIGRWRVIVYGQPYEYVYEEIRAIAAQKDVPIADIIERSETMHWLATANECRDRAKALLRRELAKSHLYDITLLSQPILEVDDQIQVRDQRLGNDDLWTFYITSISHVLKREGGKADTMVLSAWNTCQETDDD